MKFAGGRILVDGFVAVELVYTFHCVCLDRPDFVGPVSLLDSDILFPGGATLLLYYVGSTTMTRYPHHGFRIPGEDYLLTRCPSTLCPFVVSGVGVTDKKSPCPARESVCMWTATTTMERCTTRTTEDDTAQRQHTTTTLNNDNAQRLQPSSPSPPTVPTKKQRRGSTAKPTLVPPAAHPRFTSLLYTPMRMITDGVWCVPT